MSVGRTEAGGGGAGPIHWTADDHVDLQADEAQEGAGVLAPGGPRTDGIVRDDIGGAMLASSFAAAAVSRTHEVMPNEFKEVSFHPGKIRMHESWRETSLGPAFDGDTLDLNKVTPEMLKGLGADNLKIFMEIVGKFEFSVKIKNARGETVTGLWNPFTDKSDYNGATALAAKVWGSGDSEAFARVFAAAPDKILPYLTGNGARVLTAENMSLIM